MLHQSSCLYWISALKFLIFIKLFWEILEALNRKNGFLLNCIYLCLYACIYIYIYIYIYFKNNAKLFIMLYCSSKNKLIAKCKHQCIFLLYHLSLDWLCWILSHLLSWVLLCFSLLPFFLSFHSIENFPMLNFTKMKELPSQLLLKIFYSYSIIYIYIYI